jgi:hypothetical protein
MEYIHAQKHLAPKVAPANNSLRRGTIIPFVKLLEQFLENRSLRSLYSSDEAVLQGVVEMLLDPPGTRTPELRLVMDGKKERNFGRYGFVDVFVTSEEGHGVLLELKDIRLAGIISGRRRKWDDWPSYADMELVAEELSTMDEKSLDALPFMYWSRDQKQAISTTVGKTRMAALKHLDECVRVVKMGGAAQYSDIGVLDSRVKISPGHGKLFSFVVIAIGGRRVLWQSHEPVQTKFWYRSTRS